MKWIASGLVIIILLLWGPSFIRYFISRIKLFFQFQRIKSLSNDSRLKYKSVFSLFADLDSKTSQFLLYSKGCLYIIKLCGCFKKKTEIVALDSNRWQIFTLKSFNLAQEKEPQVKATDITLDFKLKQEKQAIKEFLKDEAIKVKNVILFAPEPASFYEKIQGNNEAVGFGGEWNEHLIATPHVLMDIIKNSEQVNAKISDDDWDRIVKEYKKIK